jgi:hypothetical protein
MPQTALVISSGEEWQASQHRPCDFALIAMLGLLGLRIFEATGADITDLGEEHDHRVLRVCGKATNTSWPPTWPPAPDRNRLPWPKPGETPGIAE